MRQEEIERAAKLCEEIDAISVNLTNEQQSLIIANAHQAVEPASSASTSCYDEVLSEDGDTSKLLLEKWRKLFEDSDFFVRYKNYLEICIVSDLEADHLKWVGFIESRVRQLVLLLQQVDSLQVHPWPSSFSPPDQEDVKSSSIAPSAVEKRPFKSLIYIGLRYISTPTPIQSASVPGGEPQKKKEVDLTPAVAEFERQVNEWPGKTPAMKPLSIHPVRRDDIPPFVCSPEKRQMLLQRNSAGGRRSGGGRLSGGSASARPATTSLESVLGPRAASQRETSDEQQQHVKRARSEDIVDTLGVPRPTSTSCL